MNLVSSLPEAIVLMYAQTILLSRPLFGDGIRLGCVLPAIFASSLGVFFVIFLGGAALQHLCGAFLFHKALSGRALDDMTIDFVQSPAP